MKKFRSHKGGLLGLGVMLVCLCPRLGYSVTVGSSVETESAAATTVITREQIEQTDTGTGIFSRLPFHVSVSARGGYDDNVFTSDVVRMESWFTNFGAAATYEFGSPRTQLSLGVGGGATYYFDRPGDDFDPNVYLNLSLTHKASPRLTFAAVVMAYLVSGPVMWARARRA